MPYFWPLFEPPTGCLKMGKIEKSLLSFRVRKGCTLKLAMCGPWFLEISAQSWPICHFLKRPDFRPLSADADALFPIPHFRASVMVGKKCAPLSNPHPRLGYETRVRRNGDGMSALPGNPGEIMANIIFHRSKRPSLRALIVAMNPIFRPYSRSPSMADKTWAELSDPFPRLGFGKRVR